MRTGEQLATTRTLVTAGRVTRLDLVRAHQVENELEAGSSTALHRAERARNRLATLTGKTPDALHVPDASRMNGTEMLATSSVGPPTSVVRLKNGDCQKMPAFDTSGW
jgi:outer membrane protein TolC